MTCPWMETTSALFDGELAGEAERKARAHLEACRECAAFARGASAIREALAEAGHEPVAAPPAHFGPRRLWTGLAAAAAIVVVFLLAVTRTPPPRESTPGSAFAGLDGGGRASIHVSEARE